MQAQKDLNDCSVVLRWNFMVITILGLWPASPSNFRFFISFIWLIYATILQYIDLFLSIDNLELILLNVTENVAFTQSLFRMYIMRSNLNVFGELLNEIKKDLYAKDYTEDERNTFISYNVKSKIVMKMFIINTALTATSYYTKPLFGQIHESKFRKHEFFIYYSAPNDYLEKLMRK